MPTKRKTTKKKTAAQSQQRAYMIGGLIIIFAILSMLSLYSEQMGVFGELTSSAIGILFGKVGPVFCVLLFVIGLFFIADWDVKTKMKILGLGLTVFLMAILFTYDPTRPSLSWDARMNLTGPYVDPGFIGENFARLFVGLLGPVGSRTVLALIAASG